MDSIENAKVFLKENWKKGLDCPCCGRYVKLYTYSFNSSMAKLLIFMYKQKKLGNTPIHIEQTLADKGIRSVQVQSKLVHWGLIEPIENLDTAKRMSGYYFLTDEGEKFVLGFSRLPKSIDYYNEVVYARSEELIDIKQALGKKFNYAELMLN